MKREQILKRALLIVSITFMLPLAASAQRNASKFTYYVAYEAEEIARDQSQVATIISLGGLEVDGVEATTSNMRYANDHSQTLNYSNWVIVDVVPGKHKVEVLYYGNDHTIVMEPIEFDFEAGKVYRMEMKIWKMIVKEYSDKKVIEQIKETRKTAEYKQPQP